MSFFDFLRSNVRWLSAGVLLTLASGFGQTFFISVFAGEIRQEFGLSHGAWGGIYSLGTTASAIMMIWAGALTDKFRVRSLGAIVMIGLALACLSMAMAPAAWALPFVVFLLRFTGQGMNSHIASVAMARWYVATRGRALAIASLGYAIGEAALPLIFVSLMSLFYWRFLWVLCGLLALLCIPAILALLKEERTPQSVADDSPSTGMLGLHWQRFGVLRHWLFWAVIPSLMAPSAFITALFFHQVHLAEVKGLSHAALVALFPVYTIVGVLSTLVFGWLIDRFGTARLMPIYQLPLAAGFVLFSYAESYFAAGLAMAVMAITVGGQATLAVAFWAEFYGTKHLGAIKAMAMAALVFGSAIGPGVTGYLIDQGLKFEDQMAGIAIFTIAASGLVAIAVGRARQMLTVAP